MSKTYRKDLDVLKGIAIIAVVFYHLGILKSGYLAVDIFLVINGFFIIPSICRHLWDGDFKYFDFLKRRFLRFLPLVLLASVLCLLVGAWGMLPDDYENLAQATVASNLLSVNILSSITSKNYWNALNDYKPLMHMWYLGVLAQFYVVFPLILMGFNKLFGRKKEQSDATRLKTMNLFLGSLCIISVICYLCPFSFGLNPLTAEGIRFYWLQNRLFELGLGGLVGLNLHRLSWLNRYQWTSVISFLGLLLVICLGLFTFDINVIGSHLPVVGAESQYGTGLLLPPAALLFITIALSGIVIAQDNTRNSLVRAITTCPLLAFVGKMSLSIFVWHQFIIAFYRYFFTNEISVLFVVLYLITVFGISYLTYRWIEKTVVSSKPIWATILAVDAITIAAAMLIYMNAGVIRDVPELDIDHNNVHRSMHSEYCDRIYKYQTPFPDNEKLNILIIGNSFARDWGNVLLESSLNDKINISYIYTDYKLDKLKEKHGEIIEQSDYVFLFTAKESIPEFFWKYVKNEDRVYGLGTKNFGQNNGSIYRHRHEPDYFDQTVKANPEYDEVNVRWKSQWGDHYLDFIEKVRTEDNRIRVFSDTHQFLSQDCEHLTRGGAQFFASAFDLSFIETKK